VTSPALPSPAAVAPSPPLPAVVIGGYLGAGKTTLVNHLLRHAGGRRIAVLVNDFGDVAIDAELIEGADGDVLSLAGGCVCCSFGTDLVGALARMAARSPPPDQVLIETSGVGLPRAVARSAALAAGIAVEAIVVVADAESLRRQAGARYVGDTVRQQLHEADLLILAKADLVDDATLGALRGWLQAQRVAAPCIPAAHGAVAPQVVFGPRSAVNRAPNDDVEVFAWNPPVRAAERFAARSQTFAGPIDAAALGAALAARGVLRAKGLVLDVGGRWLELQLAGQRLELRPARRAPAAGAAGRLVTIELRER
jgi:G3E family GTPase